MKKSMKFLASSFLSRIIHSWLWIGVCGFLVQSCGAADEGGRPSEKACPKTCQVMNTSGPLSLGAISHAEQDPPQSDRELVTVREKGNPNVLGITLLLEEWERQEELERQQESLRQEELERRQAVALECQAELKELERQQASEREKLKRQLQELEEGKKRKRITSEETKKQQALQLECQAELEGLKRRQASKREEFKRQKENAREKNKKQLRSKREETKKRKVMEDEELRQCQAIHYEKWKEEKKSQELHRIPPPIPPVAQGYEVLYERFLKGALIYNPRKRTRSYPVELLGIERWFPIKWLDNPLEGTFDLSYCGNAGDYLSISTGYRKEIKPENAKKVEIWIAPRFLIEKDLDTTAAHFKPIMKDWEEKFPVGIFWNGGSDPLGWYDYLTIESIESLSRDNLYKKRQSARRQGVVRIPGRVNGENSRLLSKSGVEFSLDFSGDCSAL